MRRESLRKPMSSSDDPNEATRNQRSLLPHEQGLRSQDPDYMRQLTIDTLVQQGQELVWKRQMKDATKPLERSLNILRGIEVLKLPVEGSKRSSRVSTLVQREEKAAAVGEEENRQPGQIDAGPTIQTLCLVYSRAGEWQKVYDLAELALSIGDSGPGLHISAQEIVLDVKLRRAVALTHLAGPTDSEPHRLPVFDYLDKAEKDLIEVEKTRPKDDAVRRGLQHVAFLKKQSQLAVSANASQEPLTGLARLRAMDA